MDRLTKVMSCSDGAKIYDVSNELFKANCSRADKTRMILEKLADYEDLEEQGKLLKLPCSVGDIVWYADNEIKIESIKIQEKSSIVYQGSSINGGYGKFWFNSSDLGKIVFLTEAEAYAKLDLGVTIGQILYIIPEDGQDIRKTEVVSINPHYYNDAGFKIS